MHKDDPIGGWDGITVRFGEGCSDFSVERMFEYVLNGTTVVTVTLDDDTRFAAKLTGFIRIPGPGISWDDNAFTFVGWLDSVDEACAWDLEAFVEFDRVVALEIQ